MIERRDIYNESSALTCMISKGELKVPMYCQCVLQNLSSQPQTTFDLRERDGDGIVFYALSAIFQPYIYIEREGD